MSKDLKVLPLPANVRKHLNEERMLGDQILEFMEIGYCEIAGTPWIVFPIKKPDGGLVYKLKGMPGSEIKAKNWPQGSGVQFYGRELLKEKNIERVVICEGEPDALVLMQHGIVAVTSTGGAGAFREEWLDELPKETPVILCFDADEPGDKGREKVRTMIKERRPDCLLFDVDFQGMGAAGFDVTDYWKLCKERGEDPVKGFLSLVTAYNPIDEEERKVADIGRPKKEMTVEEWRGVVQEKFQPLALTAEVVCSVVCQLLIKDIRNPFALILTDKPGSGKTITLNFIKGIKNLTYMSSDFSPAAFVTNIAARSQEQLQQIDLLPRIRWKSLLVKDLAPILSDNDDVLRKRLGMLTDVLDGEGYTTDSGVYGQRGYSGDYLFMFIAASTPFPGRIWKLMVGLGQRFFFLGIGSPRKTVSDLQMQIRSASYKVKEKECQEATHDLLKTIWGKQTELIEWDQEKDDVNVILYICRIAEFLALFRGDVFVHEERWTQGEILVSTEPRTEDPSRINQCLYNLVRGHAVLCGRNYLKMEDLWPAVRVAFDTAPRPRPNLLREMILRGGKINTDQAAERLGTSTKTARKELHKLVSLEVCDGDIEKEEDPFESVKGQSKLTVTLREDFLWLLDIVKIPTVASALGETWKEKGEELPGQQMPF
jgi:5S rRNA maturation endonuclease (ribonuclease M5)